MELSLAGIITAVSAIIGLIAWGLRTEFVARSTKEELGKINAEHKEEIVEIYKEMNEVAKRLETHKENTSVHHNSELITFQFQTVQKTIDEMKATMKSGFEKMDKYFGLDK